MKYHEFLRLISSPGVTPRNAVGGRASEGKLTALKSAICFEMPHWDSLGEVGAIPELVRIPYEVTWLEGSAKFGRGGDETWGFLCTNDDRMEDHGYGCLVQAFIWFEADANNGVAAWRPTVVFAISCKSREWSSEGIKQPQLNTDRGRTSYEESDPEMFRNICDYSASFVSTFLSLLNCKNVERELHEPSPDSKKRRAKQGKPPLFSYWTLDLSERRAANAGFGGTHSSPRLHLRRGHFRRYAPEKTCWVNPHTVGNKELGMVHKDYSMSAPS